MPPKALSGRFRIPQQIERIPLADDLSDAWVEMIMNPSVSVVDALRTESQVYQLLAAEGREADYYPGPTWLPAIAKILRGWNLETADGAPLPATEAGLRELDWTLLLAVVNAWMAARALPKSTPRLSVTTPAA